MRSWSARHSGARPTRSGTAGLVRPASSIGSHPRRPSALEHQSARSAVVSGDRTTRHGVCRSLTPRFTLRVANPCGPAFTGTRSWSPPPLASPTSPPTSLQERRAPARRMCAPPSETVRREGRRDPRMSPAASRTTRRGAMSGTVPAPQSPPSLVANARQVASGSASHRCRKCLSAERRHAPERRGYQARCAACVQYSTACRDDRVV